MGAQAKSSPPRCFSFPPAMPEDDPHIIRLRGPWEYEVLARSELMSDGTTRDVAGDLPAPGRIHLPADWGETLGSEFRGRVVYRRRFSCPTGLTSSETVDLIVEQVDAFGRCRLNGRPIGEIPFGAAFRADVTALLKRRNLLEIEVELPRTPAGSVPLRRGARENLPGGLIGEVRLEIYENF